MLEYGKDLTVERQKRQPFGFKAERVHRSVLVDGSTARPGGTLNIMFSKIKNEVIVPGSVYLSFKAKPTSLTDKEAHFVQNLERAVVTEKNLKFNGKSATSINEYDEYKLYTDLWLSKGERKQRIYCKVLRNLSG